MYMHDRSRPQKTAHLDSVTDAFPFDRHDPDGGRFAVDHPDCRFVRDNGGDGVSVPSSAAAIMPSSSDTGMNAPESPPTWPEAMMPPFLTESFSSARAAVVPCVPHVSSPISSRILATLSPTAGVGASDRSTMPISVPSRLFHRFRNNIQGRPLAALQGMMHHARARNTHVDDRIRFADSMESAGHKRVVLHGVAEYNQLRTPDRIPVRG